MADILLNVEGMKVYYPVKGDLGKGREFVKAVDGAFPSRCERARCSAS